MGGVASVMGTTEIEERPTDAALLEAAYAHFTAGDYENARRNAETLLGSNYPDTKKKAEELLQRLSPPPLTKYLLLLTGLLLAAVTVIAYAH